ncbi:hypothetical protein SAMN05216259_1212 [Actinacidiphila guanduensis]|uniref:Uncharacterized protein n=1 Tax=Actinacidiphila guanduensis TaxID=310781 RepID=A0A1H0R6W8_9ACTN|nr:hypothetical protein SAMN05216259_1212 [Actinacidiphila guanduensis]
MEAEQVRAERSSAAWERIEAWLRTHTPRTYVALPGPAEPAAVAEAVPGALWPVREQGSGGGPERAARQDPSGSERDR